MLQQWLYHISEFYSVLHYFSDNRFALILLALFVVVLIFCWNYVFVSQKHKTWLKQNKYLIAQYEALQLDLNDFGQDLCSCKNCNERDMQLWNFQKQLLVIRCSSCKINYTFTKGQNQLVLNVLIQLERVMILFKTLISYRYHPIGRLLANELRVDIAALNTATTPLELIHFTAQSEYMITLNSSKNIVVHQWEVVLPVNSERLAS